MTSHDKVVNLKLNADMIDKLTRQKSLVLECIKPGVLELVLNDARIRIDVHNKTNTEATYYNHNSSTLHYLGDAVSATTTMVKKPITKKAIEKPSRRLDIPQPEPKLIKKPKHTNPIPPISQHIVPAPSTPPIKRGSTPPIKHTPPIKPSSTPPMKPSSTPPIKQSSTPPIKPSSTPPMKPSSTPPIKQSSTPTPPVIQKTPSESKYPNESKYPIRVRIIQRLALQPWSLIELVKSLNRKQQEKCEQLEVKRILESVGIPIKKDDRKKFCLKPNLYKEIQIWQWPFYSTTEKQTVADNAKEAYELLQHQGLDTDRSNLVNPAEKGKPPTSPIEKTTLLKPSSANKKYASKALPSSSLKKEADTRKRKVYEPHSSMKPVDIPSQRMFDAYCHHYVHAQADYSRIKKFFKTNFPDYIRVLETTPPPKGTKRSYFDLKVEYQNMVKTNYLKQADDHALKEAEDFLLDCSNKRRRLNYMWASIKQNMDQHHYKIPKKFIFN